MAQKRKTGHSGDLFIEDSGQLRLVDKSAEQQALEKSEVECLGMTFHNEDERRAYFTERLREKLADPEFRKMPGFPKGCDEDIIRMSDAPWYTACPNPFLPDFVSVYARPYDPKERYERDPFAVDTSVGKTDALYKAHGYHTKVPHLAIVPSILHYTEPGDIVLDGFAGSGMTGVAAQWCGSAPSEYRKQLEAEWLKQGLPKPKWGARRAVLNDLGPAATFIAANYTLPFDIIAFSKAAQRILTEVEKELGWMYETLHTDGKTKGRINYTVWTEVFSCSECAGEINFLAEALDQDTKRIRDTFLCPSCNAEMTKSRMQRIYEAEIDTVTGEQIRTPKRRPVLINYSVGKAKFEKTPTSADLEILDRVIKLPIPAVAPTQTLPYMHMTHERARMDLAGITHVHHFFLARPLNALASIWKRAIKESDTRLRNMLLFLFEQGVRNLSLLNSYEPLAFSQNARGQKGVYYVPSTHSEVSPWFFFDGKLGRLIKAFSTLQMRDATAITSTGNCGQLLLGADSVDYIFTDPPFGENIYYADMNYLFESWHRVFTDADPEAIVDRAKKKTVVEYQTLMRACFKEYARVLKPGRWMTVVFSNSSNAVWRAIQEALGTSGFVVADVRTLDKQQGSYRQVTSTAVKQDLVISVYKPTEALTERFRLAGC